MRMCDVRQQMGNLGYEGDERDRKEEGASPSSAHTEKKQKGEKTQFPSEEEMKRREEKRGGMTHAPTHSTATTTRATHMVPRAAEGGR